MSSLTNIEWTATVHPDGTVTPGSTWNPVRGCTKVSPGCANCYAETFAERFRGVPGHPYEQGFDLRLVPEQLEKPLHWKKPRRIFVNSMSDLFQDGVPDEYIDRVFAVMALCPQHTFQVLTKRAERMRDYIEKLSGRLVELWDLTNQPTWISLPAGRSFPRYPDNWPLPNVWLGVSVENQHFADERIQLLLQTPAAVRFISAEPLLAPVDLNGIEHEDAVISALFCEEDPRDCGSLGSATLDWVIVGGESGPGARPFDLAWARPVNAGMDHRRIVPTAENQREHRGACVGQRRPGGRLDR